MLPNRESGPQNQPRAKVAVSVTAGTCWSRGGMAFVTAEVVPAVAISFSSTLMRVEVPSRSISKSPAFPGPNVLFLVMIATTLFYDARFIKLAARRWHRFIADLDSFHT